MNVQRVYDKLIEERRNVQKAHDKQVADRYEWKRIAPGYYRAVDYAHDTVIEIRYYGRNKKNSYRINNQEWRKIQLSGDMNYVKRVAVDYATHLDLSGERNEQQP